MISIRLGVLLSAAALAWQAAPPSAPSPPEDARLKISDVEHVSGITGIRMVARGAMTGAGGALNFADASGLLLMVNIGAAQLYDQAKNQKSIAIQGKEQPLLLFHAAVPGLGDEAFDSPPGSMQWVVYVKKGRQAFSVSTFFSKGRAAAPRLTMAQLQALAKIIASRLP